VRHQLFISDIFARKTNQSRQYLVVRLVAFPTFDINISHYFAGKTNQSGNANVALQNVFFYRIQKGVLLNGMITLDEIGNNI
jgi:hypothetical protein